ncbi:MAG: class I SAM-dependent methyltransferase [Methyloligella sp. ZOD6]
MWDERFRQPGYFYGTEPSEFLKREAHHLRPGRKALAIADGEGRNSVFMAEKGMEVTAMDGSAVAIEKAKKLAAERNVEIDFRVGDITAWDWEPETYDVVAGIFFQFLTPDERKDVFDGLRRSLRKGGVLLLHGYRPDQVDYGTGGPPYRENMYTETLLWEEFASLEVLRLEAYDKVIEEGQGHNGMSALIDLVARKI